MKDKQGSNSAAFLSSQPQNSKSTPTEYSFPTFQMNDFAEGSDAQLYQEHLSESSDEYIDDYYAAAMSFPKRPVTGKAAAGEPSHIRASSNGLPT